MYESSNILIEPSNNQLLWRYMPLERLIDLLETEELYFAHIPTFDDGLEGSLTVRTREHLFRWFVSQGSMPEIAHMDVKQYETHYSAFYANCWHMNNFESYLMWKAYADRGYAIRTTYERVHTSFEAFAGTITGGIVNYVDFERGLTPVGNVFHHVVTKDLPYADEREFRLFFWRHDLNNQAIEPEFTGIRVKVDIRRLIERVYINPAEDVFPKLLDLLKSYNIECDSSLISLRKT